MKQFPLLLMPLLASVCSAEPAGVTITLTMPDPAALHIRYDVPPACGELVFLNNGIAPSDAQRMRAGWQAMDACTQTDAARLTRAPLPGAVDGTAGALARCRAGWRGSASGWRPPYSGPDGYGGSAPVLPCPRRCAW